MNKEWSDLNKKMQSQFKKESTFADGIETILELRLKLFNELYGLKEELSREEFNAIPFIKADGYHSKTIAYSIWHIFRIEDIVAHSLIKKDEQIFISDNYQERIGSPIITTGNELVGQQIADFSEMLNLDELYQYIVSVKDSTNELLRNLSYNDLSLNFKQISQLSFHRLANGDKSWFSRRFRHLSYREKLRITLRSSAQLSVQK